MQIFDILKKLSNNYYEANILAFMGNDVKNIVENIFMTYEKEVIPMIDYLSVNEKRQLIELLQSDEIRHNIFTEQTIEIINNSLGISKKIIK